MIQLFQGDCLTVMKELPDESVDAVITDPPYGIDYQSNHRKKEARYAKIKNDAAPFIWFFPDAYRILKPDSAILTFCRWDKAEAFRLAMQWAGFTVKSSVVWDRQHHGMGDLTGAYAPCHDIILFGAKGRFIFPGARPKDVISFLRLGSDKLTHPNEKPVGLMRLLIEHVTTPGQVVCDPFMGSGASGEAALTSGRGYIGIELDEHYYGLASDRLRNHV